MIDDGTATNPEYEPIGVACLGETQVPADGDPLPPRLDSKSASA